MKYCCICFKTVIKLVDSRAPSRANVCKRRHVAVNRRKWGCMSKVAQTIMGCKTGMIYTFIVMAIGNKLNEIMIEKKYEHNLCSCKIASHFQFEIYCLLFK